MKDKDICTNATLRQSNIELLRILAIFSILVYHGGFSSTGFPSMEELVLQPVGTFFRYLSESITIICVDVFILISGWFGIKQKSKNFFRFCFQCLFFFTLVYAVLVFLNFEELNGKGILGLFALTKVNWFIKAYIGLYILAPVLNSFTNNASKRQIELFLITFYSFQCIYSWLTNAATFIEYGFSTFSFIGLYVLGSYIKNYPNKFTQKSKLFDFSVIALIVLGETMTAILLTGHPLATRVVYSNISPLVILNSVYLLLLFSKFKMQNKSINFIAASSFAAFLLHGNPYAYPIFQMTVKWLNSNYDGIELSLLLFSLFISVFIIAILIDQIQKIVSKKIILILFDKSNNIKDK